MAVARVEGPPAGFAGIVRHIAVVGLAGIVTGVLVGGIGSRIFMRIAGATARQAAQGATTEAGFTVREITLGGTIALILIVGIGTGVLGAALYVVFRPWLGWAGRLRGAVFGLVLFVLGSATSDVMNPDNVDFFILGNAAVDVLLITALFVTFGAVLDSVHRGIDRRAPAGHAASTYLFAGIAFLGIATAVPLLIFTMFTTASCDCDPPLLAGAFTVLAASGTLLWWIGGRRPEAARAAPVAGYLGLAGALAFGLTRVISDAADLIG